ncbi:MAG: hypothetical protein AAF563_24980 [Pseudomonadota bacterium]
MKRVKWRAIWLVCWALILIADFLFGLRTHLSSLVTGAELDEPDIFHYRLQTGLLVVFVVVALAPVVWPILQRLFVEKTPTKPVELERDERDASLAEALSYLVHQSAWGAARDTADEDGLQDAADLLEEAARKGRLHVRGVPPGGTSRETVTADYWLSAAIDMVATLDGTGSGGQGVARDKKKGGHIPIYQAMVVDREALKKLWPPDNAWRRTSRATARGLAQSVRLANRKPNPD